MTPESINVPDTFNSPSLPTWRTIKLGTFQDVGELKKALTTSGFSISDWADDIMDKPEFCLASEEEEVELVVATVKELGFTSNTRYDVLCTRIEELGYALCPAEVGPQLRLQYPDQESGERWMIIAMKPIIDSERDLSVFQLTRVRRRLLLVFKRDICELTAFPSRWHGNPNFVWYPDGRLVFLRRKPRGKIRDSGAVEKVT